MESGVSFADWRKMAEKEFDLVHVGLSGLAEAVPKRSGRDEGGPVRLPLYTVSA